MLDVILLSDVVLTISEQKEVKVRRLEQCVAIESGWIFFFFFFFFFFLFCFNCGVVFSSLGDTCIELFDSGAGSRMLMYFPTAEQRELWLRRLVFASTLTKSKFRNGTKKRQTICNLVSWKFPKSHRAFSKRKYRVRRI